MYVYRIHSRRYGPLDPSGAARAGGRWNPVGLSMLYAAAAFEGALLEQLVRAGLGRLARDRAASRIVIPDDLEIRVMDESDHPEWSREAVSRRMGEEWATSRASVAMVVPSVVARPWGRNVLINPAHEAFGRVEVAEVVEAVWDPRLA